MILKIVSYFPTEKLIVQNIIHIFSHPYTKPIGKDILFHLPKKGQSKCISQKNFKTLNEFTQNQILLKCIL